MNIRYSLRDWLLSVTGEEILKQDIQDNLVHAGTDLRWLRLNKCKKAGNGQLISNQRENPSPAHMTTLKQILNVLFKFW